MLSESERASLAARLRRGRTPLQAGIPRRPPGSEIPLSYGQEQLWFIDRIAPGRATYNVAGSFRLRGPLDEAALGRALSALAARHESLRTRLVTGDDGRPLQQVDEPSPVPLPRHEVAAGELDAFAVACAAPPFDLAAGPLLRADLARLGPRDHVLVVVVHHAVFDGWSLGVMRRELAELYRAEATGTPAALDPLPIQFGDYAIWERERLAGDSQQQLVDYWCDRLEGVPALQLPTDRPRPPLEDFRGAVERAGLDPALLEALRGLAREEGTTLVVCLLAALQVLLHRYTGQDDVVVGIPSANRTRTELAPLIGYLVNTLPIRTDCAGDPGFRELVRRVRDATVGAYAHQDLPFARMVEALRIERDASRAPLAQVLFLYAEMDGDGAAGIEAAGVELSLHEGAGDPGTAKLDLTFGVGAGEHRFDVVVQYATSLFERETIRRMIGHFGVLLAGIAEDPSQRLSRLPLLTDAELHRELVEWNETGVALDIACFHERFERQAAATPGAVAAEMEDERVTYAELNADANRIARRLHDLGVGPEALVGIAMAPAPRRLAAVLGILKAGGGYVPLDPDLPADRIAWIAADAGLRVVVCDAASEGRLPLLPATVVCLDREWDAVSRFDAGDPRYPVATSNVAYVIYTSGSTGTPKGVVVEHRQAMNVIVGMIEEFGLGPGDRVLQYAKLAFDVSVGDMFLALLSGATAVIVEPEARSSPPRLAEVIRRGVTFMGFPAPVLGLLAGEQFPDLRVIFCAGDYMSAEVARDWIRPGLRLCNGYGPTETCIWGTFDVVDGSVMPPPIGRPQPNYTCYVLDDHLNPLPVGVVGELHMGGASIARGYLGQPELTARRFLPDPFSDEPGARIYRTGDLVKRMEDGRIRFVGRADGQVKVNGLRIELGEVESALASHPEVEQAVVTVLGDTDRGRQLVGYVLARPGEGPPESRLDVAGLRAHLAGWLPGYMVPSQIVVLDRFPLSRNGKVDRRALPAPAAAGAAGTYAPPATLVETLVVDSFASVLGVERVGVDDGFFDIGGNSLQAMRLITRLRDDLAVDLDVSAVFLSPTPRQLAARIEAAAGEHGHGARGGRVVPLDAADAAPPLFAVHAVGGTVHGYVPLAGALAGAYHLYGIEAAGAGEGSSPARSLDAMVARYVDAIRAVQPAGPYRLAGWSMGGIVAFEIARLLEELGEEVALLALLDAPCRIPEEPGLSEDALAAEFAADASRTAGHDPAAPAGGTAAQVLARLAGALGGELEGELQRSFELYGANRRLISGYRPEGPVRAPALLLTAGRSPNAAHAPLWEGVLQGAVTRLEVDADHYGFLRPPLVADVAAALAGCREMEPAR